MTADQMKKAEKLMRIHREVTHALTDYEEGGLNYRPSVAMDYLDDITVEGINSKIVDGLKKRIAEIDKEFEAL